MKKKEKNMTLEDLCEREMKRSLGGASRLERLGEMNERLGDVIEGALSDASQFNRYIVSEKGKNEAGDSVTENVEKIFCKVDFKSVKEAAGAIKALSESVKSVFSLPDFGDMQSVVSNSASPEEARHVTVTFERGEEFTK